jgi:hypothetical protein
MLNKTKGNGLMQSFSQLKKNMEALNQLNITIAQMPVLMKEFGVWWKVTRNLKEIEGSWTRAFKSYARMFEGVPKKKIPALYQPVCEIKESESEKRSIT